MMVLAFCRLQALNPGKGGGVEVLQEKLGWGVQPFS